MNGLNLAMFVYIGSMLFAIFLSFKYGSFMIRKTRMFLPQALIAWSLYFTFCLVAIVGWFLYAWGINEFLFFGGLVFGTGVLIVGEVVLITSFCVKRKKWIQQY
ncbi:hypothetical protein [Bacillus pinisoli]|uniref:hypothetical protein n=1 Tax=Bacillus pinisoli TaxID=2901866 RepID=UPI001FF55803|nr:hypothetical protein [Bacillus pinisoli]